MPVIPAKSALPSVYQLAGAQAALSAIPARFRCYTGPQSLFVSPGRPAPFARLLVSWRPNVSIPQSASIPSTNRQSRTFAMNKIGPCIFLAFSASIATAQATAAGPAAAPATPPSQASAATGAAAAAPASHLLPAVRAVMIFRASMDSRSVKPGREFTATLEQAVTIPGGPTLPKGTPIVGTVAAVSRHSKGRPNGAIELDFKRADPKGGEPVPLVVRILSLSPPIGFDVSRVTLPNSNGNMVATAAASGGLLEQRYEQNDHTPSQGKYKDNSPLEGVYVSPTKQTSGAAFSLNEDVYLDSGIQITVLLAASTAAPK
jgi:hypothetical protein